MTIFVYLCEAHHSDVRSRTRPKFNWWGKNSHWNIFSQLPWPDTIALHLRGLIITSRYIYGTYLSWKKRYKRISEHINVKINRTNIKQTNIPTANAANFRIFSNIPHTLRAWYYSNWTGNVRELGCCAGLSSGESCDGRSGFDLAISAFTTRGRAQIT